VTNNLKTKNDNHLITILGPTAAGKTALAARIASELNGEVISCDSRQVYRGMDIGTGKDYEDYLVNGITVPVHLIDIVDAGVEYNIFNFQKDFISVYHDVTGRGKQPVLCGGSGMYLESVIKGYDLKQIANDPLYDRSLEQKTDAELKALLLASSIPHNTTDLIDRRRMMKAVRIAYSSGNEKEPQFSVPFIDSTLFGIRFEREILRQRITERLVKRLESGMIGEVKSLLDKGLTTEQIKFYGLEYRYVMMYLEKELDYQKMFTLLNTAIHQFAKRQMTWFRRMERNGLTIHWLDGNLDMYDKIITIKSILGRTG
jgi:tRNA dimethylallyltransferase